MEWKYDSFVSLFLFRNWLKWVFWIWRYDFHGHNHKMERVTFDCTCVRFLGFIWMKTIVNDAKGESDDGY